MFISCISDMKLSIKVALLAMAGAAFAVAALVSLSGWLSSQYHQLAQEEVDSVIQADLDHITGGICRIVRIQDEASKGKVKQDLAVARNMLDSMGAVRMGNETISWRAINQFSNEEISLNLPKFMIGESWLGCNNDFSVETPLVDKITRLTGTTCTIFQRINERGDMLRVATTVTNHQRQRAIGTYIPALQPDGSANPVIKAVMEGQVFQGRAYVVDDWYITAYEPLKDNDGKLIGMLYAGIPQKQSEARVRGAVLDTKVGKSGYIYVLSGEGADRGRYIISYKGERDGENIWDSMDSDGNHVVQDIIAKAKSLKPNELGLVRYRWQNPGEPEPRWKIARIAYYAPWDWVIGTSVYEDELREYKAILEQGKWRTTGIMCLAGLVLMLLLAVLAMRAAISITKPVKQLILAAERITAGDLDCHVDAGCGGEIGSLAEAFNYMSARLKATMDGLQRSEADFRRIFENAIEGIFLTSVSGRLVKASPTLARMLKYGSPEEMEAALTDLRSQLYADPKDRDLLLAELKEKGRVFSREIRYRCKDGSIIWTALSAQPLADIGGGVPGLQGFILDITERKRAEAGLLEAQRRQQQIFDFLPDAAFVINREGVVIAWNRAIEEMTGMMAADVMGKGDYEYALPFYGVRRPILIDLVFKTSEEIEAKYLFVHRENGALTAETKTMLKGRETYLWGKAVPLVDQDGNLVGAIEAIRDITDTKKAESALKETTDQLAFTIEAAQIGTFDYHYDIGKTKWNKISSQMWGMAGAEWVNYDEAMRFIHPEDINRVRLNVALAMKPEGSHVIDEEFRIIWPDGSVHWNLAKGRVYFEGQEADSKPIRMIGIHLDLTEQRKAQEHLRQVEKLGAIGQLAGGVAHDFNNQLGGIFGFAELLQRQLKDEKLKSFADGILGCATRASALTSKMLAFARKGNYLRGPVDVHKVIEETVEMLVHSIDKRISVQKALEARPSIVNGDASQLQNALLNLAVNARDAMPEGGTLTFQTSVEHLAERDISALMAEMQPGMYISVQVGDTGSGMSDEVKKHLFEPFFTTKGPGQGTGMGLAAVYGTVKSHGGHIKIYSEAGHGTTIKLLLPIGESELVEVGNNAEFKPSQRHLRILVVDDEQAIRLSLAAMLRDEGHMVSEAANGREAMEIYRNSWREIDLVILDMIMPEMNGRDCFRAMRQVNPSAKVLVASGFSSTGEAQVLLAEGALGFIQKPFFWAVLGKKLDEAAGS